MKRIYWRTTYTKLLVLLMPSIALQLLTLLHRQLQLHQEIAISLPIAQLAAHLSTTSATEARVSRSSTAWTKSARSSNGSDSAPAYGVSERAGSP